MTRYNADLDESIIAVSELKQERAALDKQIKSVEASIMKSMMANDLDKYESSVGKITKTTRSTATFDDETKAEIESVKNRAIDAGRVEFKFTTFPRVTRK